jgi:hypothetical protein
MCTNSPLFGMWKYLPYIYKYSFKLHLHLGSKRNYSPKDRYVQFISNRKFLTFSNEDALKALLNAVAEFIDS